jgi:L-lactate dehydrogenase complex protein LldE
MDNKVKGLFLHKGVAMTVGLFVPCYIDQFYPGVAVASLGLLEKFGCRVSVPLQQTCCGQPMANSGFAHLTGSCDRNFQKQFSGFEYIVAPSGSCIAHIKEHHPDTELRTRVFELTEFLTDVLKVTSVAARFPYRVGLHQSCHGQRMLHLSSMSERVEAPFSKAEQLLRDVEGLELSYPVRPDECCGFGGTFCVTEAALSVAMGADRVAEHEANGVQYITGGDTSCLMHLEGVLRRRGSSIKVIHLAEILNAS